MTISKKAFEIKNIWVLVEESGAIAPQHHKNPRLYYDTKYEAQSWGLYGQTPAKAIISVELI